VWFLIRLSMHMVHSIDGLLDCYYCLRGTHWDARMSALKIGFCKNGCF